MAGSGTATSKIPLRQIASLFSHLGANTKAQITDAFAEAEDMMNFSNNSNVNTQERRTLSSYVASPILNSTTNNRGFDVFWDRLDDRAISSYEVQVSFDSVFSNPDDYVVVDTSLALEGIGTTVYVRVRGVRFDGQTGPWSDTISINAFATTAGPVVYTRGFDDVSSFYKADLTTAAPGPLQHITITPQRQNGGIVVFGSLAVGETNPGGVITVKINSTTLDSIDMSSIPDTSPFSIGFGPAFLTHEGFNFSAADRLTPSTATQSGSGVGTFVGWSNLANATGAMETVYPAAGTDYQQSNMVAGQSLASKDLKLTNFGAAVPVGNTITGIEVTFTGNFTTAHVDPAKSYVFIRHMRIIDETGSVTTFDQTTTQHWPFSSSVGAGAPVPFATFGGPTDLWNKTPGFWTPAKLNSANFGFDVVAGFHVGATDAIVAGDGTFDAILMGMEMTVFSINQDQEASVTVSYTGASFAPLLGLTLNAIEFGSALT